MVRWSFGVVELNLAKTTGCLELVNVADLPNWIQDPLSVVEVYVVHGGEIEDASTSRLAIDQANWQG